MKNVSSLALQQSCLGGRSEQEFGRGWSWSGSCWARVQEKLGFQEGKWGKMGSTDHTFPQLNLPAWAPFNKAPSRLGPWKQAGSEEEGGPPVGPSLG